ncbi:MAG TPA: NUDIX domain-containing protein [Bacillales bacterium]|nr:NUDIX domain-containing protein [Bacillales bacterium]
MRGREPFWEKGYPALSTVVKWGVVQARFRLLREDASIDEQIVSNVSIIPYSGEDYVVFQIADGDGELPGGTLEAGEHYRETLRREMMEELAAS